ncbi:unnamed protein product [Chilo suppressalis]|uniref:Uncharacterized protein n=1 Tax=Chilo suppressalis TaxID=168631 RepID=A0ABN8BE06_CHISP|nr:unnamed protein product [Chilo suppressalis]
MLTVEFSRGRAVLGARAWRRRPVRIWRATVGREKSEISGSAVSEQAGAFLVIASACKSVEKNVEAGSRTHVFCAVNRENLVKPNPIRRGRVYGHSGVARVVFGARVRCTERRESHKHKRSRRATDGRRVARRGGWRCARTPHPARCAPAPRPPLAPRLTPAGRLITSRVAPLPFSSCSCDCELFATATLPPAPSIV